MSLTALLFVLAFSTGCIFALVRHPIYGLMTYVAVFYLHPPSRWWGQGLLYDIRWSLLAAAVTLLALMLRRGRPQTAPVFRSGLFWGLIGLILWLTIQSLWALDREAHFDQLSIYMKLAIAIVMICKCIETERHLRLFLWSHVVGCFYLGWLAFTSYTGGRLDGVGGPGIDDANSGALQMVTGVFAASSLFLAGSYKARTILLMMIPFMVNGLIATISRTGFLAVLVGGLAYNLLTPKKYRVRVFVLSILAATLFGLLANNLYWERMGTIRYRGEDLPGIDTGGGRLEIMRAQFEMFQLYPFGCGHMCTTVLSPQYLEDRFLSRGYRASHNTFMSMLVDHGIIGAVAYVLLAIWIVVSLRTIYRRCSECDDFLAISLPSLGSVLIAILVGDMFVQHVKFEARFWFLALLLVQLQLSHSIARRSLEQQTAHRATTPIGASR
ncbi:MAG: O-antigen ligase family protein [Gammaproteobacteria bacterium]|nr:O-antigen ligase family protein [Gammaproteobacteria bacterium]